jgi:DNA mismatch repair protein MutS2
MEDVSLLPTVPSPLSETSASALAWPQLRDHIADLSVSPLGRAFTLALEPSADLAWIDQQQERTAEIRSFLTSDASFDFHGLFDPTTLLEKSRLEGATLEPLEISQLLTVIERVAAWRAQLIPSPATSPRNWRSIAALSAPLLDHDLAPLLRTLRGKIEPDGTISDDASPELRRIRRAMERQHRAIEESLRKSLRALSAEGSTQEDLITVRGERFVIPVKSEFRRKVPGVIHGSSSSGQTVFVEPLETIEQNNELIRLLDEEQSEIHRILVALTNAIGQQADAILLGVSILAEVESHFARARFANDLNCVPPTFPLQSNELSFRPEMAHHAAAAEKPATSPATALSLLNARHPLLELRLRREGTTPVPLTLALEQDARQLIISGPNTGGKTVALKTTGLLALMAQAGLPIPADSATLPIFHSIYADIGDAQSIEQNLSSFSAHILNLDHIAREADQDSLVLLDELGSATDPEEGAALAVAIAQHFLHVRAWTIITTHLTALKVYAAAHSTPEPGASHLASEMWEGAPQTFKAQPRVLNAAVGFDQATLSPTYQLRLGVPGASAGLNIAERLGLDPHIIQNARAQLTTQAADIGALLDSVHDQLTATAIERETLQLRERELTRERLRLETEGRAEQKARTKELEAKLNSLLDDFAYQLRETVKAIDDKAVAQKIQRASATTMARAKREFSEQFNSTVVAHTTRADKNDPNAQPHLPKGIKVGDLVKLKSLGRQARVDRLLDNNTFEVSAGAMKMRIPLSDIAEVETVKVVTPLEAARRRGGVTIQTTENPDYLPSEINVIGRSADEAHDEVSRFLDRAFLAGLPRIRIVHGTGMGILRRTLREFLRNHPHVATVTEPPHNQGGQGATEVELRQ